MNSPDGFVDASRRRSPDLSREFAEFELPFTAEGLYELRATLSAHASQLGVPDVQIEHLLIVAGELASNAIRHGDGTGQVRLWEYEGWLYCQVSDHGPGFADPTVGSVRPDPTDSQASRGIWICRNLSDELTIEPGPRGRGARVMAAIPPPTDPVKG